MSEKTQSDQKLKRINQMKNDGMKNKSGCEMFFMRINTLQFMINRLNAFHIACFRELRGKLIIMNGGMARNRTHDCIENTLRYITSSAMWVYAIQRGTRQRRTQYVLLSRDLYMKIN